MPSRIIHDILTHLLETSDVHRIEAPSIDFANIHNGSFRQMYMQRPHEMLTLRRTIRDGELYDLPVNIYEELMGVLEGWMRSGQPIDINRRFKRVYLTHVEHMVSHTSLGTDFRLEFKMSEEDVDYDYQPRRRDEPNYAFPRRSAVLSHTFGQPQFNEAPKKAKKKVEEHFDEELFEL